VSGRETEDRTRLVKGAEPGGEAMLRKQGPGRTQENADPYYEGGKKKKGFEAEGVEATTEKALGAHPCSSKKQYSWQPIIEATWV